MMVDPDVQRLAKKLIDAGDHESVFPLLARLKELGDWRERELFLAYGQTFVLWDDLSPGGGSVLPVALGSGNVMSRGQRAALMNQTILSLVALFWPELCPDGPREYARTCRERFREYMARLRAEDAACAATAQVAPAAVPPGIFNF